MRNRAATLIAAVLAFLVSTAVYVPIAPQPLEQEPDLSFRATTHDAFARRLQIGTDIVSTYGPWGILQRGFDRRTDAYVLIVSALLGAAFAWGTVRVSVDAGAPAAIAFLAAATAACVLAAAGHDARFTFLPLLLVLSTLEKPSMGREWPLAAALGPVALIKFSLLVLCAFVIAMTALIRRSTVHAAAFAIALITAWIVAGQHASSFPKFLRWGMEVAGGYAGASVIGSPAVLTFVAAAGLMAMALAVERNGLRLLLVIGSAAYVVKIGIVRSDVVHAAAVDGLLLVLFIGYALVRRTEFGRARRAMTLAAMAAVIVGIVTGAPVLAASMRANWWSARHWSGRAARWDRAMALRSGSASVPAVAGTIDAYPWGSAELIAREMRYAPRPVFQSTMVWTATLAELNAASLRRRDAPQWIWASVHTIDDHLPLLDDGPAWLEILRRYEPASVANDHLLLRKRALPRPMPLVPSGSMTARFGESITLPDTSPLWCSIEMHPTLLTRLRSLLWRPPVVTMEITAVDGSRNTWRVPVATMRGGFLISPEVTTTPELALLLSGHSSRRAIRARLFASGYGTDFILRLSTVGSDRARNLQSLP